MLLAACWGLNQVLQDQAPPPQYWRMKIDSAVHEAARHTDEKLMIREYLYRIDSLEQAIKSEH